MTLELEQSKETGKTWPHGERERRPLTPGYPKLSPAMRSLLEDHHDETFEKGRAAGRLEMEEEFMGSGIITLGLGAVSGAFICWLIERLFA